MSSKLATAQPVFLFGKNDNAASLGRFIRQGCELRRVRERWQLDARRGSMYG